MNDLDKLKKLLEKNFVLRVEWFGKEFIRKEDYVKEKNKLIKKYKSIKSATTKKNLLRLIVLKNILIKSMLIGSSFLPHLGFEQRMQKDSKILN